MIWTVGSAVTANLNSIRPSRIRSTSVAGVVYTEKCQRYLRDRTEPSWVYLYTPLLNLLILLLLAPMIPRVNPIAYAKCMMIVAIGNSRPIRLPCFIPIMRALAKSAELYTQGRTRPVIRHEPGRQRPTISEISSRKKKATGTSWRMDAGSPCFRKTATRQYPYWQYCQNN